MNITTRIATAIEVILFIAVCMWDGWHLVMEAAPK